MSRHHPNPFDHDARARAERTEATRAMWSALRVRLFAPSAKATRG